MFITHVGSFEVTTLRKWSQVFLSGLSFKSSETVLLTHSVGANPFQVCYLLLASLWSLTEELHMDTNSPALPFGSFSDASGNPWEGWRQGSACGYQKVASVIGHFNLKSWPPCLGLPGFLCCHGNTYKDLPREKKRGRKKKKDRNLGKAVVFRGRSLILIKWCNVEYDLLYCSFVSQLTAWFYNCEHIQLTFLFKKSQ